MPSSTEDSQLEGIVLQIFEKMDVKVDPQNVEAYHWLKSNKVFKGVIIKLPKRKNADKKCKELREIFLNILIKFSGC